MFSILVFSVPAILAVEDSLVAAPQEFHAVARLLSTIDWVVVGIGILLVFVFLVRLIRRGRRDPLAAAPIRINEFREDSLALAMLAYLLAALALGGVFQFIYGEKDDAMRNLLAGSGAQLVGAVMCLVIASKRFSGGSRRFVRGTGIYRARAILSMLGGGLVLALTICPAVLAGFVALVLQYNPEYELPVHPTITALRGMESAFPQRLVLWTGAAVIAPVAEEFFFRGMLQTLLLNTLKSRWPAILIASTVFAAIHFSQPHAIPALFVLAVIMGYAYERSGSLIPPIAIHSLFNLKTLIWDSFGSQT
ncbi:MAG: CPBP family intramembrane metalloprotease [Planctomycetes bacterium]|nr:CPBP family intramembrane metalloprotease [Planctomycetota bacterium]